MRDLVRWILISWLIAGTLDALSAIIVYRANPSRLFQFIASGAFGAGRAFTGGTTMVLAGILFHYLIALTWTIIFFLIAPAVFKVTRNRVLVAIVYGVIVWCVMNLIVLPMSKIPSRAFDLSAATTGAMILIFAIGIPLSFLAFNFYNKRGKAIENGIKQ